MYTSKAAGPDGIHPAMVKPPSEVLVKHFNQVFSASLGEGQLPADWLTWIAMPVHERGNRGNSGSH